MKYALLMAVLLVASIVPAGASDLWTLKVENNSNGGVLVRAHVRVPGKPLAEDVSKCVYPGQVNFSLTRIVDYVTVVVTGMPCGGKVYAGQTIVEHWHGVEVRGNIATPRITFPRLRE